MTRPTFGQDRDAGVLAGRVRNVPLSERPNPMVVAHGPDPQGRTCEGCRFLRYKGGHGRHFYGCTERGPFTHGPATDHLVRWPACALYEPEEDVHA